MELTREQTIKALECCENQNYCKDCPLFRSVSCETALKANALCYLKEKEPAPDTSEDKLNTKIVHTDDSTSYAFCQAIKDGIEMIKHDSVIAFSGEMPINEYIARLAEIFGICEILEKVAIYAQGDK